MSFSWPRTGATGARLVAVCTRWLVALAAVLFLGYLMLWNLKAVVLAFIALVAILFPVVLMLGPQNNSSPATPAVEPTPTAPAEATTADLSFLKLWVPDLDQQDPALN
jgi:hypothetical protein